jgi:hypothetical protein
MNWLVLIIAKKLFFVGVCGYFPNSFGIKSAGIILLLTGSFCLRDDKNIIQNPYGEYCRIV